MHRETMPLDDFTQGLGSQGARALLTARLSCGVLGNWHLVE